ncbi:Polyketide synthase [Hyella patelloides LEGE 07179]|uniref:Phenolphthiocerol/phthiocerol polyketide synthase subunit E n=1 Tax=Hyella patelloides LEGE 07179 TaxID=945734 RepID=A0A563W518_9CYAN|nr:type I polyketide synthase [Hyella patelloides]VEP18730.1 Polyketide synthase [Hyella patelloides LEGE 07179]
MQSQLTDLEVAVIGVSGRFPGSKNLEDFWENLVNGVELTSVFTDSASDKTIKAGAVLDDVELFDAEFFGYNPREAETMDPQHRMFLECAWEAIENAGYNSEAETRPIGVYAGVGMGTYLLYNLNPNKELMESRGFLSTLIGVDKDYLPTRVSYKLNLTGPSVSVGTACSSSLVAVHFACQSLLSGECDMSLAAGVAVKVPQSEVTLSPNEIAAADGHCRAFDAKASGTIGGNGIGVVVLKRLEDALDDRDHIYGVIKGSAINNDGAMKVGYTAPSESGQTRAIKAAQIMAEVEPETITYLEAHGTGTPLGDPIEVAAMTEAFRANNSKKGYCAIGSVKTNVGHLDAAAGITGFIKTVLSLDHQLLPPSINFESSNPQIDFANSPFYVNTELSEWKTNGIPRRAGVSSFGIGGTNAHVVLEEAPVVEPSSPSKTRQLLLLSAKTSSALEKATTNLLNHLKADPELNLADVAYTLKVGRQPFKHRRAVVCQNTEDAILALQDPKRVLTSSIESSDRNVVFMFTGQGAQYVNMARELYHSEPTFTEQVDLCCELLVPQLKLDLRQVIYPTEADTETATQQLQQTAITQPALFVIEYALAQLWMSWGVRPVAMIGHSIGEYVAATLSGVFFLEDALALVTARGQLMQQLPSGSMLSVALSEQEVRPYLGSELSVAVINGSDSCVISGATEAVEALQNQLLTLDVDCRLLHTSHAFHSPMMEPILAPFKERVAQVSLKSPQIPYLSNVTGSWITTQEATSAEYWLNHIKQTVRFEQGLQELFKKPTQVLLEVGPGRTLSKLAKQHKQKQPEQIVLTSIRHPKEQQSDIEFLLKTLGQLWLAGGQIDWSGFYAHEQRHRLPLPTYSFERQKYWIEAPKPAVKQSLTTASKLWSSLIKTGQSQANVSVSESEQQTYQKNQQWLDSLCAAYINLALRNLGAFGNSDKKYSLEELWEQCQIIPRYRPLLSQWLQKLLQQGNLQQHEKQFTNLASCSIETVNNLLKEVKLHWKNSLEIVNLVERCGNNLAAVLTGKKEPLEFFDGFLYNFSAAENTNRESPGYSHYSTIIRSLTEQVVGSLSAQTNLRIMEIGSGIGYATEELLPVLSSKQTNYTFADVGNSFFNEAKQKFGQYPFIECRAVDINRPFTEQGYFEGSFDLVVAVKSLHVAQDINTALENVRSLLAPGGILLVWEKTQQTFDIDMTWALLMNPSQEEKRSLDNLYLSQEQWQEALRTNGFVEIAAVSGTAALGQQLLMARTNTEAKRSIPSAFTKTLELKEARHVSQISSGKKSDIADWFYIPSWKRCLPLHLSQLEERKTQLGCCLVFVDECGLGALVLKRLEAEGGNVITVKIGEQFSRESKSTKGQTIYTINPRKRDDYDTLIEELIALDLLPKTIVHLWSLTPQNRAELALENLDRVQEQGFYSLLFLAQALEKQGVSDKLQIAAISNNLQSVTGEEELSPEKATLLGPIKTIPIEYPNISCCSIDIVLPQAESLQEYKLVEQLMIELTTQFSEQIIAYRGRHRWQQSYEPVQTKIEAEENVPSLHEGGVYLITGGLGGIGLVIAEHLARTVKAKLILSGRSEFPARDQWEQWLASHEQHDKVSEKIRQVKALEALGAEVLVVSADVSVLEQMQALVERAGERFGEIHGVIHAAGVAIPGKIKSRTLDIVESVLAAKIKGISVLETVFQDTQLDFLILFSSLSSISGGFAVDYVAANAFLDTYAHYHTVKDDNSFLIIAVNWDNWQQVGMAVQNEVPEELKPFYEEYQKNSISPEEGKELFDYILRYQLPQIIVSGRDLQAAIRQHRYAQEMEAGIGVSSSKQLYHRPDLSNSYVLPRNQVEQTLAEIWQKLLGIEKVGIYDNFFELRGDSLLATRVISKINQKFQIHLPASSLFEAPTVEKLALAIEKIIVEELEEITEEEAQKFVLERFLG